MHEMKNMFAVNVHDFHTCESCLLCVFRKETKEPSLFCSTYPQAREMAPAANDVAVPGSAQRVFHFTQTPV